MHNWWYTMYLLKLWAQKNKYLVSKAHKGTYSVFENYSIAHFVFSVFYSLSILSYNNIAIRAFFAHSQAKNIEIDRLRFNIKIVHWFDNTEFIRKIIPMYLML